MLPALKDNLTSFEVSLSQMRTNNVLLHFVDDMPGQVSFDDEARDKILTDLCKSYDDLYQGFRSFFDSFYLK